MWQIGQAENHVNLWQSIRQQWPVIVQAIAAIAQVVTAILIVRLTHRLVRATDTYAGWTKALVDLTAKQYADESIPMWHLSLPQGPEGTVSLIVFNLSRNSARVTHLLIRVESEDDEPRKFVLDLGMPSGWKENTGDVSPYILQTLQPYIANGEWAGVIRIEIAFHVGDSSVPIPSAPFRFRVTVRDGRLTSVTPKLSPVIEARRENPQ